MAPDNLTPEIVRKIRRSRRHPRPTQFDYLHLRYIVEHLRIALSRVDPPPRDVLDLWCGTRPYDDLLPARANVVGMDVDDAAGVADVVSREFLPFPDASFDLVMCIQAFYYAEDPDAAIAEIRRVLRPGGTALVMLPLVWEYDRNAFERRYTGPELAALFRDWEGVELVENGGRVVTWTTLTGHLLHVAERKLLPWPLPVRLPLRAGFRAIYVAINALGMQLDRADRRWSRDFRTLPMNLMLVAHRPARD